MPQTTLRDSKPRLQESMNNLQPNWPIRMTKLVIPDYCSHFYKKKAVKKPNVERFSIYFLKVNGWLDWCDLNYNRIMQTYHVVSCMCVDESSYFYYHSNIESEQISPAIAYSFSLCKHSLYIIIYAAKYGQHINKISDDIV